MENLKNRFAERLNAFLRPKKIQQKDLSKALGVSLGSLNRVLNGHTEPSLELLAKLDNMFEDMDIRFLLTGKPNNGNAAPDVSNNQESQIAYLNDKVNQLESTVKTLIGMVHFPGRDLSGQPVIPDHRAAIKQPGSKLPRNRYAGLSMIVFGSYFGSERAAA